MAVRRKTNQVQCVASGALLLDPEIGIKGTTGVGSKGDIGVVGGAGTKGEVGSVSKVVLHKVVTKYTKYDPECYCSI